MQQAGNSTIEIKTLRTFEREIFETLNHLNPLGIVLTESMIFLYTIEIN